MRRLIWTAVLLAGTQRHACLRARFGAFAIFLSLITAGLGAEPDGAGPGAPQSPGALQEGSAKTSVPTYAVEVARVIQKNCLECHRKGQVGPFPLETYEQVRKRAGDIARVVAERVMPPWKAVHGFGKPFQNDRSLSNAEVKTLEAWAEAGAPLGDPAKVPAPVAFPERWALGTPDLVLEPPETFTVPADGRDVYHCFVLPTQLARDVYVSAVEYQPDNRRIVHHISGRTCRSADQDRGLGFRLAE
jgi:hypothetical protein